MGMPAAEAKVAAKADSESEKGRPQSGSCLCAKGGVLCSGICNIRDAR